MFENYKIITVTHQHLNVEDIAQFTILREDLSTNEDKLACLGEVLGTKELMYLNTCNRVTFIFHGSQLIDDEFLIHFFKLINPNISTQNISSISKYVQVFEGQEAAEHLFQVAASMESLVIGEREIFRQLREAYQTSLDLGYVGDHMRILEKFMVTTAKKVYAKTAIGENPVSVVSLAIKKFIASKPKPNSKILLIGAGETNTLVGKFLAKYNFQDVSIFNRSLDNAAQLTEILKAQAYHLSDLANHTSGFDAIFICTASTKPIIDINLYRSLIQRDDSLKTIVDLSVPHNVDQNVIEQYKIDYIDIESLRILAEQNLNLRKAELTKAKSIVDIAVVEFTIACQNRKIEKMLRFIPKEIEVLKSHALDTVYKNKIEQLDPTSQALIKEMMNYMAKKCVAVPMRLAKNQ